MKRRLFLTGPIGCGKSTAIQTALGEKITLCGGFLTRRYREPYLHFTLESPDRNVKETFLDFSGGKPEVDMDVFSRVSFRGHILLLDEIGGIELLNPELLAALERVLRSETPVIGVMKGDGPASALIRTLGLTAEYTEKSEKLREFLKNDPETLLYECKQFDDTALLLARQWTEEYLHD